MFSSRKDFVQWERFLFIASWSIVDVQYKKSDALNPLFVTWITNSIHDRLARVKIKVHGLKSDIFTFPASREPQSRPGRE
jgi:hypothetical protein